MARRRDGDNSPRLTTSIQICLTSREKKILSAYADMKYNGKLGPAARSLLVGTLVRAVEKHGPVPHVCSLMGRTLEGTRTLEEQSVAIG